MKWDFRHRAVVAALLLFVFFWVMSFKKSCQTALMLSEVSLSIIVTLVIVEQVINKDREHQWKNVKLLTYNSILAQIRGLVAATNSAHLVGIDINKINDDSGKEMAISIVEIARKMRRNYRYSLWNWYYNRMQDRICREYDMLELFYNDTRYILDTLQYILIPRVLELSNNKEINERLVNFDSAIQQFESAFIKLQQIQHHPPPEECARPLFPRADPPIFQFYTLDKIRLHINTMTTLAPLFTEAGILYELIHQELSEYSSSSPYEKRAKTPKEGPINTPFTDPEFMRKRSPDFVGNLIKKGAAFGKLGMHEEALRCYDTILKSKPNFAEALCGKGVAFGNLNRNEEALEWFDRALKIKPNYAVAWSNKGESLLELGRYEEALECQDKATEIEKDMPEIWSNKGNALAKLGRYEEALECYDKALKIKIDFVEAWFGKYNALEALRKTPECQ